MAVPIVHHPAYTAPLPHRRGFPMGKYGMLIQLLREQGLATAQTLHVPDLAPRWWLELAHDSAYVDGILSQSADDDVMRRIGLPLSPQLAIRSQAAVGGTVLRRAWPCGGASPPTAPAAAIMRALATGRAIASSTMSPWRRGCCRPWVWP